LRCRPADLFVGNCVSASTPLTANLLPLRVAEAHHRFCRRWLLSTAASTGSSRSSHSPKKSRSTLEWSESYWCCIHPSILRGSLASRAISFLRFITFKFQRSLRLSSKGISRRDDSRPRFINFFWVNSVVALTSPNGTRCGAALFLSSTPTCCTAHQQPCAGGGC
jgi:hypothetical protein